MAVGVTEKEWKVENMTYKEKWEQEFKALIMSSERKKTINEWKELLSKEEVVYIYGAGHLGRMLADYLHKCDISVSSFVDQNPDKEGKEIIWGIKCILPEQMKEDALILVAVEVGNDLAHRLCSKYSEKVYNASNLILPKAKEVEEILALPKEELLSILERMGTVFDMLEDEHSAQTYYYILKGLFIEKPYHNCFAKSYCDRNEYFRKEIFNPNKSRNFIDCGAYEGDTFEEYLTFVDQKFENAYLFEMDEHSADILETRIQNFGEEIKKKTYIFNRGVYDQEISLAISNTLHDGMAMVDMEGQKKQVFDTLDHCVGNRLVDFIKMDIEGSELAGLRGAKKMIQKNKPNLAICIYHKVGDLWEIPECIKQLVPEYRFYIRHCSHYDQDMILYATTN